MPEKAGGESVFEHAAVGMVRADADGRITHVNRAFCDLIGYSMDELVGQMLRQFAHPDYRETPDEFHQLLQREISSYHRENRYLHKDGTPIWTDITVSVQRDKSGHHVSTVHVIRDITAQKRDEQQQEDEKIYAEHIVETIHEPLLVLTNDMRVKSANPAFYENFQVVPEETVGYLIYELGNGQWDIPKLRELLEDVLPNNDVFNDYEVTHNFESIGERHMLINARRLDHVQLILIGIRDITEREQMARERASHAALQELNQTLEQRVLERTVELEAANERLRLLANELTETEQRERRQLAEIIHDHLQQLLVAAKMQINSMRVSGSIKPGEFVESLLDQAIEEARTLTTQLRPPALYENGIISALTWLAGSMKELHGIDVELDLDEDAAPDVEQGAVLVFQSVRELLFNVAKYAGVTDARMTLIKTWDGMMVLSVEDKGKGFDVAALKTGTPASGGFGLFSIRARMQALGGECEIRSIPGTGTTVFLYVPIGKKPKSRSEQGPEIFDESGPVPVPDSEQENPDGLIRVVIADDHSIVRQGLARIVEDAHGMTVVREVSDGRAALEAAVELRPHIIIMDVNMPDMNGVQSTRAIKEAAPGVEIIGLSIHTDDAIRQAMIDAGAKAYYPKDGDTETLVSSIRALAGRAEPEPA